MTVIIANQIAVAMISLRSSTTGRLNAAIMNPIVAMQLRRLTLFVVPARRKSKSAVAEVMSAFAGSATKIVLSVDQIGLACERTSSGVVEQRRHIEQVASAMTEWLRPFRR
ncbi:MULTISPECIES: hypothetical protein [Thiorhodovibrio]|uniref:hypothetical protein n=1 Tax=Thiorhodovibrio TaxID=61593 RepID=UPI0019115FEF|nr:MULTISPECIES: hypothetical protein [Thiorhodovibrio]